jgi:hypothetical protein
MEKGFQRKIGRGEEAKAERGGERMQKCKTAGLRSILALLFSWRSFPRKLYN